MDTYVWALLAVKFGNLVRGLDGVASRLSSETPLVQIILVVKLSISSVKSTYSIEWRGAEIRERRSPQGRSHGEREETT